MLLLWHQHVDLEWSKLMSGLETCQLLCFLRYKLFSSLLSLVQWWTDRRTESDAYEPTMHKHRCAQEPTVHKHRCAQTQFLFLTLTFKPILAGVKANPHAKNQGRRSSSSAVRAQTGIHTDETDNITSSTKAGGKHHTPPLTNHCWNRHNMLLKDNNKIGNYLLGSVHYCVRFLQFEQRSNLFWPTHPPSNSNMEDKKMCTPWKILSFLTY